jgi:hypothetical protein
VSESRHTYWSRQIDSLATEISRLCVVCDIKMLEPGIAERVLKGDQSVCGRRNPEVFEKIRRHLMAFFQIEEKAIHRLGADEVKKILDAVRVSLERLRNGTD